MSKLQQRGTSVRRGTQATLVVRLFAGQGDADTAPIKKILDRRPYG